MTKFNFKRGSATKKGKLKTVRALCPEHTLYPIYFNEDGTKRTDEEIIKSQAERLNKMANCKTCKKEIYYLKTKLGKLNPVDVETMESEEVERCKNGEEVAFDHTRHISHFATCPDAQKFRKEKRSEPQDKK